MTATSCRSLVGRLALVLALVAPLFVAGPAPAELAGGDPGVRVPGFWDPRRRPERPDLSRVTLIRFITEIDYPPFNYSGPDGNPAGFNVDLARMICEELKIACTVQMRRFDTLLPSLADNRGDAVMASIAVTPESAQARRFQRPVLSHARRASWRAATSRSNDVRPEQLEGKKVAVVAGTAHEAFLKALFTEVDVRPYRHAGRWRARRCARGEVDLLFGDGISLAFWLNGTDSAELLRLSRRAVHRKPLLRRRGRHRGQARQRHAAPGVQLGAVPAVGKGPIQRSVAALFPDQPVLIVDPAQIDATGGGSYERRRPENMMSVTETAASLRELAEQSNAWPFEEARKIVARLKKTAEGRGDLRDRLRPVRPAAYRHVRRGGAHHHGAPCLSRADRRQDQDAADRVLRRHGRAAQGARTTCRTRTCWRSISASR